MKSDFGHFRPISNKFRAFSGRIRNFEISGVFGQNFAPEITKLSVELLSQISGKLRNFTSVANQFGFKIVLFDPKNRQNRLSTYPPKSCKRR